MRVTEYTKRGTPIETQLGSHKHTPKWLRGMIKVMADQNQKKRIVTLKFVDLTKADNYRSVTYRNYPSKIIENRLVTQFYKPLQFAIKTVVVKTACRLTDHGKEKLARKRRMQQVDR